MNTEIKISLKDLKIMIDQIHGLEYKVKHLEKMIDELCETKDNAKEVSK